MRFKLDSEPPAEEAWRAMPREGKAVLARAWTAAIVTQIGEGPYPKVPPMPPDTDRSELVERARAKWGGRRPTRLACVVSTWGGGRLTLAPLYNAIQAAGWAVSDHPRWMKMERVDYVCGAPSITVTLEA